MEDFEEAILTGLMFLIEATMHPMIHKSTILLKSQEGGLGLADPPSQCSTWSQKSQKASEYCHIDSSLGRPQTGLGAPRTPAQELRKAFIGH